jgi:L-threonylcarbamoyladenylate synthase
VNWKIREAVRQLENGGIIAYPTETVYGLGCDPFNGTAVLHLLDLKQRNIRQGLVLIASDFAQLQPLLLALTPTVKKRVTKTGPGATTWVLPCLPEVPVWLRGNHAGLAVRITRHPLAAALCKHWGGPLVSTSANLHGKQPATSPLAVRKAFNGKLDYILHGDRGSGQPSEIRDGIHGTILRSR